MTRTRFSVPEGRKSTRPVSPRRSSTVATALATCAFSISAATKELIEEEVRQLIDEGYDEARRILIEKEEQFERLAQGLLEYETLTGEEIGRIIRGEDVGGGDTTPSSSIPTVAVAKAPIRPAPDATPQPQT